MGNNVSVFVNNDLTHIKGAAIAFAETHHNGYFVCTRCISEPNDQRAVDRQRLFVIAHRKFSHCRERTIQPNMVRVSRDKNLWERNDLGIVASCFLYQSYRLFHCSCCIKPYRLCLDCSRPKFISVGHHDCQLLFV